MAQMRPGARQLLDYIYADLDEAFKNTCDPSVQRLLASVERRILKELEPLLERATPQEPSAEMRERAIQQELRELREWRKSIEPLLTMAEQYFAQAQ